jgi:protein SCO1/2/putative membrane protein
MSAWLAVMAVAAVSAPGVWGNTLQSSAEVLAAAERGDEAAADPVPAPATGAASAAGDESVVPQIPRPIVLEPSTSRNPPAVRLTEGAESGPRDPLAIGTFSLIDQLERPFTRDDVAGRPWVASFIFTHCAGECPVIMRNLKLELVDRVDDPNVLFVTISVDPERDTPARLAKYADVFGADPARWRFVTGDKEQIYRIVQHGFEQPIEVAPEGEQIPGYEIAHSLSLIHVGADGRVQGKYDGRDLQQVLALRRVLTGQSETPPENRPIVAREQPAEDGPGTADDLRTPRGPVLPDWVRRLPVTNAMLNSLATLLLVSGFLAIKLGNRRVHQRLMLLAFGTSVAFLGCYLTYHLALHHFTGTHGKSFDGTGVARTVYLGILVSHVVLAAVVPILAVSTIVQGLRERWAAHRRLARITLPIWLYVSVTGVIIYGMLYHWPGE